MASAMADNVNQGASVEDCDGYTLYGACLLHALGVPVKLVTVSADEQEPERYSHIYVVAYPAGEAGPRVPLDFSHGPAPGWECPNTGRLREWGLDTMRAPSSGAVTLAIASVLVGGVIAVRYLQKRGTL